MEQSESFPFCPASKAMNQLLYSFDEKFLNYERTISAQAAEIEELRKSNAEMMNKQLEDGNKMVADTLLACITPSFEVLNPASAIIITRISEMQTIEEVHEYIHSLKENSKEFIAGLREDGTKS